MASDTPVGGFDFDLCKRNAFLEGQMSGGAMVRKPNRGERGETGAA